MTEPNLQIAGLAARFRQIAETRMRGLPLLHPGLAVETLGFAWQKIGPDAQAGWLGILITPWCMNLVWLPGDDQPRPAEGCVREYRIGEERLDFASFDDEVCGHYQSCSLFSPMFDFIDAQAARDTATQVLSLLRRPPAAAPADPGRRRLLFGLLENRA
ncbi:[NiFe]-hydrogenase assembly chaperone HybE [Pseudomonas japonica]|uniref:[NiFe] hydrogenase assembly chaperone, HybE family n=1 Tax=Pseudomonas japonica TaxID=256466 RepID=A0A239C2W4_9PSED|nr:[NiFe]-hydrogenase assembly chaperone HybE [Pseudomonas japonica]SNS13754.1 [NiFe] hydrogenase assembly chaperone, HybE family [Pseudomonas japonica]